MFEDLFHCIEYMQNVDGQLKSHTYLLDKLF